MDTIPQTADVHPGTRPNVLQRGESLNLAFVVIVLVVSHRQRVSAGRRMGVSACGRVGVSGNVLMYWRVRLERAIRAIANVGERSVPLRQNADPFPLTVWQI